MTTPSRQTTFFAKVRRLLVILSLPILLVVACSEKGGLRPLAPTVVSNQIIAGQPQLVTFTELEADPVAYEDTLIRVTGMYIPLPVVSCMPHSGPNTAWALVAEDLRLDIIGFEALLDRLAPEELTLTLDGILRRYDGPLGCGKRPDAGVLWYLEALQIVQPNPLVQAGTGPSGVSSVVPPPFPTSTPPEPIGEGTPEEEPTTGPGTPSRTPTIAGTAAGTASSTPTLSAGETPTAQNTGTVTRTPTRTRTPTPAPTTAPGGGTATSTPTPSQTPSPESTIPGLPTSTPGGGGYPVETNTPYP